MALGRWLQAQGYGFVTVTPATHARVDARRQQSAVAHDPRLALQDVFGWSRHFDPARLPAAALEHLRAAEALHALPDGHCKSGLRFSSLDDLLFAHSAWPTEAADAVFFGPDTYRFASLIRQHAEQAGGRTLAHRIADIGCGSGAGGLLAARLAGGHCQRLVLADVNPRALELAAVNAELAGAPYAECVASDVLAAVDGEFDLIVSNPPYLVDPLERAYRHGGGPLGAALSLRILAESLPRLAPGGSLLLYTGSAIRRGEDAFGREALALLARHAGQFDHHYRELDPDVFGEDLDQPGYETVDRIAAVGLCARRHVSRGAAAG